MRAGEPCRGNDFLRISCAHTRDVLCDRGIEQLDILRQIAQMLP